MGILLLTNMSEKDFLNVIWCIVEHPLVAWLRLN